LIPHPSVSSKGNKKKGAKFQVHLHFGMQSIDWIPQLRLVPNRCNIKDSDDEGSSSDPKAKLIQSQLYNQSLLFDARHRFQDEHLASEELVDHPNVEATLVLIQVWALQRGLWRNHDGWSKENVAIFLLYMLRTNRMNPRMTPIQQFTAVLQMWSTTNWLGTSTSKGKSGNEREVRASHSEASQYSKTKSHRRDVLVVPGEDSTEKETIRKSDLARLYEKQTKESPQTNNDSSTLVEAYASGKDYSLGPVMLDPTMTYNFLGDVSPNYMKLLQNHATKSLKGLKESRSTFSNMFMKSARFWSQWDMYVKIPLKKKSGEWEPSVRSLLAKLELALGNRICGIRVMSTGNGDMSLERNDLDQTPSITIDKNFRRKQRSLSMSPTYGGEIVLGIAINPETSQRVVDRGPPSDQQNEVKAFVQLWGDKAQLRRFKDGAIVQAVVWNDNDGQDHYQNQIKLQGGYVDKIMRHIVRLHYTKEEIEFALPNLISIVDGISTNKQQVSTRLVDPVVAHQDVMKAFDALSQFLREGTQPSHFRHQTQVFLDLPLTIDAVEPLSPCLRYSELFPPIPHPSLGGTVASHDKLVSGAIISHPVQIQIRFGASSKWPSDLKAIGAAKTAMLIQLANSIESTNNRDFDGPIQVTTNYLDIGYRGYCFRIFVRADPEIKMLQGLVRPSPIASSILKTLTRANVVAAKHHSMIHAVHTLHPSSGGVVRMAKRWVASHMLSGLITTEALELMVAKVYSDFESPLEPPSTVTAGFLRFLYLLAYHDWLG
jgi:U3 small nucleolar RNA-associated protein 22